MSPRNLKPHLLHPLCAAPELVNIQQRGEGTLYTRQSSPPLPQEPGPGGSGAGPPNLFQSAPDLTRLGRRGASPQPRVSPAGAASPAPSSSSRLFLRRTGGSFPRRVRGARNGAALPSAGPCVSPGSGRPIGPNLRWGAVTGLAPSRTTLAGPWQPGEGTGRKKHAVQPEAAAPTGRVK